jgi:hypothetical protein
LVVVGANLRVRPPVGEVGYPVFSKKQESGAFFLKKHVQHNFFLLLLHFISLQTIHFINHEDKNFISIQLIPTSPNKYRPVRYHP